MTKIEMEEQIQELKKQLTIYSCVADNFHELVQKVEEVLFEGEGSEAEQLGAVKEALGITPKRMFEERMRRMA